MIDPKLNRETKTGTEKQAAFCHGNMSSSALQWTTDQAAKVFHSTFDNFRILLSNLAILWKRHSQIKKTQATCLQLGTRLYRMGIGDNDLMNQLRELDRQNAALSTNVFSAWSYNSEKNGLLRQLGMKAAEDGRELAFPLADANQLVAKDSETLKQEQARLWIHMKRHAAHLVLGYLSIFLLISVLVTGVGLAVLEKGKNESETEFNTIFTSHNPDADLKLGVKYLLGKDLPQDRQRGFQLIEASARSGNANAIDYLGYLAHENDKDALAIMKALEEDGVEIDHERVQAYTKNRVQQLDQLNSVIATLHAKAEYHRSEAARIDAKRWPVPDLKFKSAQEWHQQYTSAPKISQAEFLDGVSDVRLRIASTNAVTSILSEDVLRKHIVTQLEAVGLKVNDSAPVRLDVTVYLNHETSTDNRKDMAFVANCYSLIVTTSFVVSTRVLREDKFVHLDVSPAHSTRLLRDLRFGKSHYMSAFDLKNYIADIMQTNLKEMQTRKQARKKVASSHSPWHATEASSWYRKYLSSRREDPIDLQRVFAGVFQVQTVEVDLNGEGTKWFNETKYQKNWETKFGQIGVRTLSDSKLDVSHEFFSWWNGAFLKPQAFDVYSHFNLITLYQDDVVYPLNGKLVRGYVMLSKQSQGNIGLPDSGSATKLIDSMTRDLVQQAQYRR